MPVHDALRGPAAFGVSLAVVLGAGGCGGEGDAGMGRPLPEPAGDSVSRGAVEAGRLRSRPHEGLKQRERPGLQRLDVAGGADGLLYVPAAYRPDRPAPLVVLLHGAGGRARSGLVPLLDRADDAGLILLAPQARGRTWDVILDEPGPDVASIDALLREVFDRFAVDPSLVALGGFSDGASYGLSLGLANGDLFSRLVAFSPGFISPVGERGRPAIFVSHGVDDTVLPIDRCSRVIVPDLRRDGYEVDYREFDGGHGVPDDVARSAVEWLQDRAPAEGAH